MAQVKSCFYCSCVGASLLFDLVDFVETGWIPWRGFVCGTTFMFILKLLEYWVEGFSAFCWNYLRFYMMFNSFPRSCFAEPTLCGCSNPFFWALFFVEWRVRPIAGWCLTDLVDLRSLEWWSEPMNEVLGGIRFSSCLVLVGGSRMVASRVGACWRLAWLAPFFVGAIIQFQI